MIIFSTKSLKKILKSKFEARLVNAVVHMAFQHNLSFATVLAANFGCYQSRIMQLMPDIVSRLLRTSVPGFCVTRGCVVQSESVLTPFFRHFFDTDLL